MILIHLIFCLSTLAYADLHHCTQLPDSIRHFPHHSYSTIAIEAALQNKIQQHTSRDSDRFRQVLKLFKAQVERELVVVE